MNKETNSLNWFEIPVTDMQRTKHFYHVSFGIHMDDMKMPGMKMAGFPYEVGSGRASGAHCTSFPTLGKYFLKELASTYTLKVILKYKFFMPSK